MKRRRRGRPTKVVTASVHQTLALGKPGVTFEVWEKWKKKRRKVGTLTVSVGGLRWRPRDSPNSRRRTWNQVAEWLE